jgi:hypothetical protein
VPLRESLSFLISLVAPRLQPSFVSLIYSLAQLRPVVLYKLLVFGCPDVIVFPHVQKIISTLTHDEAVVCHSGRLAWLGMGP